MYGAFLVTINEGQSNEICIYETVKAKCERQIFYLNEIRQVILRSFEVFFFFFSYSSFIGGSDLFEKWFTSIHSAVLIRSCRTTTHSLINIANKSIITITCIYSFCIKHERTKKKGTFHQILLFAQSSDKEIGEKSEKCSISSKLKWLWIIIAKNVGTECGLHSPFRFRFYFVGRTSNHYTIITIMW